MTIDSECLVGYVLFSSYSKHGERLVKLRLFLQLINIFLAVSVDMYCIVRCPLMTRPEVLDMTHN